MDVALFDRGNKAGNPIKKPSINKYMSVKFPSSKMSSAFEWPFIERMNGFFSDRDEFSSGIAPKCLIAHSSADHRYRMSFASRYDRKPISVVSWR
ncbi:hypothetical protein AVEN_25061-1 [Araneus ventricosus]|uniref:Uncharacterized protein n=1 Tax=Araneus ventricosus TaxID=182803 RepID=A0A4Y2WU89_ARAVE|nr:hypothetical protein AVEN_25061-1 [Araneus ventricosus]